MRKLPFYPLFILIIFCTAMMISVQARADDLYQQKPVKSKPKNSIKAQPVRLYLPADRVQVNRLKPIAFKPFMIHELRDPKTNAAITPDSIITLKNGKTISGKDYLAQINDLEKKINSYGYSLRDRRTAPILLQKSKVDTKKLQLQNNQLRASLAPAIRTQLQTPAFTAKLQTHEFASLRQMHTNRVRLLSAAKPLKPGLLQQQAPAKLPDDFQPVHYGKNWEKDLGDSDYFQASIHAKMDLDIKKDLAKVDADAGAKVTIFGHDEKLLDISGGAEAPPRDSNKPMKAHFYVKVLDEDLFTPIDEQSKDAIKKEDNIHEDFPVDYTVPFMIGPIPVSLEFGFTATVGVQYGLYISPLYVDAKITPYVHTNAHAKCGVDLLVVSGGVKLNLTLFNDDLAFGASLGLATDKPDPYVLVFYYGKQNLTALSGNFQAYVSVDLLFWSDEWDWTIFDWDGFKYNDFLFGERYDINLRTGEARKEAVAKGVRVKIKRLTVDRNAVKDLVRDKGYFVYGFIYTGDKLNVDADRDSTDYYRNNISPAGNGPENMYPFGWILGKKVPTAGKANIVLYTCYTKAKRNNESKNNLSPDGKYRCEPLRVNPQKSMNTNLVFDFESKTFSDRYGKVSGKAGEYITMAGPDGEMEFTISEYGSF